MSERAGYAKYAASRDTFGIRRATSGTSDTRGRRTTRDATARRRHRRGHRRRRRARPSRAAQTSRAVARGGVRDDAIAIRLADDFRGLIVFDYELRATSYELRATSYELKPEIDAHGRGQGTDVVPVTFGHEQDVAGREDGFQKLCGERAGMLASDGRALGIDGRPGEIIHV